MNHQRVIGINNTLPWSLPNDLRHFRTITNNHVVIMGRKTFDSIGKPLPKRNNIVITHNHSWQHTNTTTTHSLDEALQLAKRTKLPEQKVFVIGGEAIYQLALAHAEKLYITVVDNNLPGDKHFPKSLPELVSNDWVIHSQEHHDADAKHKYAFNIFVLCKK